MNLFDALRRNRAGTRGSRVRADDIFAFDGGLNLVDPPVRAAPGQLTGSLNYELGVMGGYSRVEGYERLDGQASPTRSDYWTLTVTNVPGEPWVIGNRVRQYALNESGFSSTAIKGEGIIVFIKDEGANVWTIAVTKTVVADPGTPSDFIAEGDVYTSAPFTPGPGTAAGQSTQVFRNGAVLDDTNDAIQHEKTEHLRSFIQPVGGGACEGPVLGVAIFKDRIVAWRNAAGGAEATMWETTIDPTESWKKVELGAKIMFDKGSSEIAEGTTINGQTSGATAVVRRIVSDDGTYVAGSAKGYIVVNSINGTFQANENIRASATVIGRYLSAAPQVLPPGGKYRHRVHNFFGAQDRRFLYAVNGVGQALEYDGTTVTLISTGMAVDKPTHIFVLNDHLGLCFPGGSIQNSGHQRPLNWSPVVGADERSVGGNVTALIEETNRTVFIGTRQSTYVYYGDVVENFQLRLFSPQTGVVSDTVANFGQTIYLDDHGFTTLKQTQAFGNFKTNSISDKILPLVQNLLSTQTIAGALISRKKNLYRCFFGDGTGLVCSMRQGGKIGGWTLIKYRFSPTCMDSGELEANVGYIEGQKPTPGPLFQERIFMGATDGFVYECDIGNSFDGGAIEHFLRMIYHKTNTPEVFKHYRKAVIDVDVSGVTTLFATVDFNYGNRSGQAGEEVQFIGGGGFWDIANWDEFRWSGQMVDQVVLKIEGDGFNVGLFFYGNSEREPSHTLYNVTYHYSNRKINRGSTSN